MKELALVILALVGSAASAALADEPWRFLTRRGDVVLDGDRPLRFVSWNIPNLLVIEDAYEFTRPDPWRWPDEFEIEDALESVRQMGGQVARTYVVSVYREGSDMGEIVHVRRPGEFNEEGFRALDKVIEIARRKRIRIIIPLVDQHKWWGGIAEYAAFRGKPADAFWTDRQIIDDFKTTIRYLLTRKNIYTGIVYRDEPAIFGWETGNEIEPPPEWTREIAAYIKQLDPNHLVIDGKSLGDLPLASLDDPNIDVLTTHHYPWGDDHDFTRPIRAAHAHTKGKKPYFVGEFGFVATPHIANAIQSVIDDGISGALLWSLRMHRREGGFYWHMEVGTGRNIYKAFHWPGFASGERYDERAIMQLMRTKAFEIRGRDSPPLEPPAPPRLLPIERVSAISWQGSAGATGYDIWRREQEGEWQKIAENVSDAEVQYRPLYNDDTVQPGKKYSYRVVARNAAGDSEPSNAVGPLLATCRTLVDECGNFTLTHSHDGGVRLATENARTVQEDCHRFAMPPSATVTYRVDGPLSRCRVFSFVRDEDAELELAISGDGKSFQPIDTQQQAFPSAQTVYGYLTPVLFDGNLAEDANARFLRISLPSDDSSSDSVPLEIGRVEVEYDRPSHAADATQKTSKRMATPLNASVFVDHPRFIQGALAAIDKAAERGDRRLNVVVTIHVDLTKDLRIKSFGRLRGPDREYRPYDPAMHDELKRALREVFARMVRHNMEIFVLPHIDAGGEVRQWRNWIDFDPLESYAGYSYEQLMLGTLIEALEASARDDTRIELALSGEMGTSLFRYPGAYRQIVRRLREETRLKNLKLGISLNHGGIAGENNPTGAKNIQLSDEDRAQMQALINESDFIGMSFYRPVRLPPTTDDFVRGIDHFMGEFHAHGLSVPATTPVHFSEVGIGGGYKNQPTGNPELAVQTPWAGTANPHDNPWRDPPMQQLRRQYHAALLDFLATQPAPWQVSAAFLWSMGSWDPQEMQHPAFADPEIIPAILRHNAAAAGRIPKAGKH